MAKVLRVLIVDDNEDDALLMVRQIERDGYEVISDRVDTAEAMKAAMEETDWDVVLADYSMPYFSGPHALTLTREMDPDMPCIIISGTMGEDIAVAMMRAGANDYLMKDNLNRLTPAIEREMRDAAVRRKRKEAEAALAKSEKRFRSVVETANNAIISADNRGMIIFWNESAERIFGYTAGEIINKPLTTIMPQQYHEAHRKGLQRISEGGQSRLLGKTVEFEGLRKDGSIFPIELSVTRWGLDSGTFFTGIINNITQRKQAETEREHLLKVLKSKNEELQSIVYVSSHDLKTPLVNIGGFSSMLTQHCEQLEELIEKANISDDIRKEIISLIEENIPEDLKFICSGSSRMNTLIDGLLRVSRIGSSDLKHEEIDMNKMITETINTIKYQIDEAGASITIDCLPDCSGDLSQINHVFSNLIDNALKYLDPARQGIIRISARVTGNKSVYCVEDNGIGIDQAYEGKIFEIYHRLEPDGPVSGEGLGLTIIRRVLDRNDGETWMESEPGKGSKFFVSLPTVKKK